MLAINNVEVVYDNVVLVLKGVSLSAKHRTITTLLGANGAGKTTTLKAISGILHAERGQLTRGTIEFDGTRLDSPGAARGRTMWRHAGVRRTTRIREFDSRGEPYRGRPSAKGLGRNPQRAGRRLQALSAAP